MSPEASANRVLFKSGKKQGWNGKFGSDNYIKEFCFSKRGISGLLKIFIFTFRHLHSVGPKCFLWITSIKDSFDSCDIWLCTIGIRTTDPWSWKRSLYRPTRYTWMLHLDEKSRHLPTSLSYSKKDWHSNLVDRWMAFDRGSYLVNTLF